MTTTARGTARDIISALDECFHDAREQGFEGDRDQWRPTEADLEYVTDKPGHKPTREQWEHAGITWVGGRHCSRR